jgi:hypothetical protein
MSRGYGKTQQKILAKLREWPAFFLNELLPKGWNNRSDMVALGRAARQLADQGKLVLSYDPPDSHRLLVSRPETIASRFIQRVVVRIGLGRYQVFEGYLLHDSYLTEGEANRLHLRLAEETGNFGGQVVGWVEAEVEALESNPALDELRRQAREVMLEDQREIARSPKPGEWPGTPVPGEVGRDLRRLGMTGGYVFKTKQRSADFIDRCNEPGEQRFRRRRERASRDHKVDYATNKEALTEDVLDDKHLRDPLTPAFSERERQTGEPHDARDDAQVIDTTSGGFSTKGRDGPHTEQFRVKRGPRRHRPNRP